MLVKCINRSDPEKVFITVKNSYSTAAVTAGQAVSWDYTTDVDGVGVTLSPAGSAQNNGGFACAGVVADASIASGDYGLVQCWGYNAGAYVACTSGGVAIAVGDMLCVDAYASKTHLTKHEQSYMTKLVMPMAFAMEAYTTRTAAKKKIFIKCL